MYTTQTKILSKQRGPGAGGFISELPPLLASLVNPCPTELYRLGLQKESSAGFVRHIEIDWQFTQRAPGIQRRVSLSGEALGQRCSGVTSPLLTQPSRMVMLMVLRWMSQDTVDAETMGDGGCQASLRPCSMSGHWAVSSTRLSQPRVCECYQPAARGATV
jgi:hypothetical protein